jgi:EAL domain-containing protein (putative c-di-GMP-specific phosphodiesterase class I)
VAVNLSASQLKLGHDLERDVAATLSKWGLAAQDLEFDVPESVLAASLGPHLDVLKKLQELGVRIAIDDFGAEYTSVGRIKSYHVKRLKIAPQFIASMTSSLLDAGAVRMMIHLANTLGIEIVAKSVETAEQQDFLLASAKDAEAQGFLYSEPLPARQATEVLRKRRIIPELERHHPADVIEVAK